MTEVFILVLAGIGIIGLIRCDNLIAKVMALNITNAAVILLFINHSSTTGSEAPILLEGVADPVDPLPQALMLTAIVIGVATTALALTLIICIQKKYGSTSLQEIEQKNLRELE